MSKSTSFSGQNGSHALPSSQTEDNDSIQGQLHTMTNNYLSIYENLKFLNAIARSNHDSITPMSKELDDLKIEMSTLKETYSTALQQNNELKKKIEVLDESIASSSRRESEGGGDHNHHHHLPSSDHERQQIIQFLTTTISESKEYCERTVAESIDDFKAEEQYAFYVVKNKLGVPLLDIKTKRIVATIPINSAFMIVSKFRIHKACSTDDMDRICSCQNNTPTFSQQSGDDLVKEIIINSCRICKNAKRPRLSTMVSAVAVLCKGVGGTNTSSSKHVDDNNNSSSEVDDEKGFNYEKIIDAESTFTEKFIVRLYCPELEYRYAEFVSHGSLPPANTRIAWKIHHNGVVNKVEASSSIQTTQNNNDRCKIEYIEYKADVMCDSDDEVVANIGYTECGESSSSSGEEEELTVPISKSRQSSSSKSSTTGAITKSVTPCSIM